MKIPVYYALEDASDELYTTLACSNCQDIIYDDLIGWMDDSSTEHRHLHGECDTSAHRIPVWVNVPKESIDLAKIPF